MCNSEGVIRYSWCLIRIKYAPLTCTLTQGPPQAVEPPTKTSQFKTFVYTLLHLSPNTETHKEECWVLESDYYSFVVRLGLTLYKMLYGPVVSFEGPTAICSFLTLPTSSDSSALLNYITP